MILLRKDEVEHLRQVGLGKYVMGKTCTGKRFAEENKRVLDVLRKYNSGIAMEG